MDKDRAINRWEVVNLSTSPGKEGFVICGVNASRCVLYPIKKSLDHITKIELVVGGIQTVYLIGECALLSFPNPTGGTMLAGSMIELRNVDGELKAYQLERRTLPAYNIYTNIPYNGLRNPMACDRKRIAVQELFKSITY